jgi:predicted enzyme related to lactoylglutathione lyase
VVEVDGRRAFWLPYVEVSDVDAATQAALGLGATVVLASREGPAGWRAVVATQDSGPVAFWHPKR